MNYFSSFLRRKMSVVTRERVFSSLGKNIYTEYLLVSPSYHHVRCARKHDMPAQIEKGEYYAFTPSSFKYRKYCPSIIKIRKNTYIRFILYNHFDNKKFKQNGSIKYIDSDNDYSTDEEQN